MAAHTVIESTLNLIRGFEGYSATAYWDVSRWSIGYGSGTLLNGAVVKVGDVITKSEGEALLKRDVEFAANYVNTWVTSAISQNMFDALTSFTYNVGIGNFQKSGLLSAVNKNSKDFASIKAAFTQAKWTTFNRYGRRAKEAEVYATGTAATSNIFWLIIVAAIAILIRKK